jgi:preprotein translocase SecE subunit
MAVAVQSSAETRKPAQPMGLIAASVIGAVFIIATAGVVLRLIPWVWDNGVGSAITGATNSFVSTALQFLVQAAAAAGLIWFGGKLASGPRHLGWKGGVLLMLGVILVGFFCLKGLYETSSSGFSTGGILLMLVYAAIVFFLVQFFRTGKFSEWAVAVDQGGWLDTHSHKRTQGHRVRRLTILGILLVAGTGIWTLMAHNYLPKNAEVTLPGGEKVMNRMGDWVVGGTVLNPITPPKDATGAEREKISAENRARPRHEGGVTLLPDLWLTVPLILMAATLWVAWRAVNFPTFADFLIATEAEINKVSWTTRKALIRDTIVVLTCLFLLTVFLFVVDWFWAAVLSSRYIGVLPTEEERAAASSGTQTSEPVKDW